MWLKEWFEEAESMMEEQRIFQYTLESDKLLYQDEDIVNDYWAVLDHVTIIGLRFRIDFDISDNPVITEYNQTGRLINLIVENNQPNQVSETKGVLRHVLARIAVEQDTNQQSDKYSTKDGAVISKSCMV